MSVKEEENKRTTVTLEKLGARDASKYLTMRKRGTDRRGRQNTFSSPNKPLLKYAHTLFFQIFSDQVSLQEKLNIVFFLIVFRFDPKSPESVLIAQKIDALFESGMCLFCLISIILTNHNYCSK